MGGTCTPRFSRLPSVRKMWTTRPSRVPTIKLLFSWRSSRSLEVDPKAAPLRSNLWPDLKKYTDDRLTQELRRIWKSLISIKECTDTVANEEHNRRVEDDEKRKKKESIDDAARSATIRRNGKRDYVPKSDSSSGSQQGSAQRGRVSNEQNATALIASMSSDRAASRHQVLREALKNAEVYGISAAEQANISKAIRWDLQRMDLHKLQVLLPACGIIQGQGRRGQGH